MLSRTVIDDHDRISGYLGEISHLTLEELSLDEFENSKKANNVLVVGIAGATRSGKSTLASLLSSFLNLGKHHRDVVNTTSLVEIP